MGKKGIQNQIMIFMNSVSKGNLANEGAKGTSVWY
jgi:hypothetical protein